MRFRTLLTLAFLAALCGVTSASPAGLTIVTPGQEKYMTQQPGNFQMATLYGDPSKSGLWVVRMKVPANFKFPMHHHGARESVEIISGTLYGGFGKKMDMAHATAFPAGTFISIPPNLSHYVFTKGPAVIDLIGTMPMKDEMEK